MTEAVSIGAIRADEIPAAARLFLDAFAPTAQLVYGQNPKPDAMVDVWSFAREEEPDTFLAARSDNGKLVGYALFTSSVRQLQRKAVFSGAIIRWLLKAIAGRYMIRWANLARQLWNKLLFVGSAGEFRTSGDAQLLNIAVAPAARGAGVAKQLVRAGMHALAKRGVHEVRLEVRTDNTPAIIAYRDTGFVERGRTRNLQGDWIVMTANPQRSAASG